MPADLDQQTELHRALPRLTAEDEKVFEDLWRTLGLSVDWAQSYARPSIAHSQRTSQKAFLHNLARGEAYSAGGTGALGYRFQVGVAQAELEDRDVPPPTTESPSGRTTGPRFHRDHPSRADRRLRRLGRSPRGRALPGAFRNDCSPPRFSRSSFRSWPIISRTPRRAPGSP